MIRTKPKRKTSRKPVTAYDLPTPEKKAFGLRMIEAREIARLTQAQAAEQLGYSQAVQLSNWENGNRTPPLQVVIACAELYGTTTDFLCGLADDSDRDPVAGMTRWMATSIKADAMRMFREIVAVNVDLMRKVMPSTAEGQRLAAATLEIGKAFATMRALNPKFDHSIRGGNTVAQKVEAAVTTAQAYQATMARAVRLMKIKSMRDAAVASGGPPCEQPGLGLQDPAADADADEAGASEDTRARELAPH